MARFVRKDRRVYEWASCTLCGTGWGGYTNKKCPSSTCLACGTTQCLGNGLACGQCSVCYIGILPGWSGSVCQCAYAGCSNQAVARIGKARKPVCQDHMTRAIAQRTSAKYGGKSITAQEYVAAALEVRDKNWVQIAD